MPAGLPKGARLKLGNESRAAIAQALLTAGAAGLSCDDLSILVKLTAQGVRWQFKRMPDEVFFARTHDTKKTRVFHAHFEAAGRAYLAACTVGRQRPGGPSEATFMRVLSLVRCAGASGIGIKDLMAAAGLSRPTMNIIMPSLCREHGVQMRRDATGKGRAARYWPAECTPSVDVCTAAVLRKAERSKPVHVQVAPAKPAAGTAPQTVAPKQIIIPANVKRTVCPAGMDHRFTVHKPEPFFSALAPGNYLHTGSAIERAYGGGR